MHTPIGSKLIPLTRQARASERARKPHAMGPETNETAASENALENVQVVRFIRDLPSKDRARSYIRLPSFETVEEDSVYYAHASRILHVESNPGNARPLVQRHGELEFG